MILAEITKDSKTYRWSLVDKGANQRDFLKLKAEKQLQLAFDDERHEVTGALLIPNQRIYRSAEYFQKTLGLNEDGYIFFNAETIKEQAIKFLEEYEPVNLDHKTDTEVNAIQLVESWIINTKEDKAYSLGLSPEDYPQFTWMGTQRINDLDLWKEVKAGKYNAFSIEATPVMRIVAEGVELNKQYSEEEIAEIIVQTIIEFNKQNHE